MPPVMLSCQCQEISAANGLILRPGELSLAGKAPWKLIFRARSARCRPSRSPCTCPASWRSTRGGKNSNALLPPLFQRVSDVHLFFCSSLGLETLTCYEIKIHLSRSNNKAYKKQYYDKNQGRDQ